MRAKHLCAHIPCEEHSPSVLAAILLSNLLGRYFPEHFESCRPHQISPIPTKYPGSCVVSTASSNRTAHTHLPILKRPWGLGTALQVAANLMPRPDSQKVPKQFLKIINFLTILYKHNLIWDFLCTSSLLHLYPSVFLNQKPGKHFIVEQEKPKQCMKPEYPIPLHHWLNSPLTHLHRWVWYEKHARLRSLQPHWKACRREGNRENESCTVLTPARAGSACQEDHSQSQQCIFCWLPDTEKPNNFF